MRTAWRDNRAADLARRTGNILIVLVEGQFNLAAAGDVTLEWATGSNTHAATIHADSWLEIDAAPAWDTVTP